MPQRGFRIQPRVSTLGPAPRKERALKGRQNRACKKHTCNNTYLELSDFKPLSCLGAHHFLREEVTAASKENDLHFERGDVLRLIHASSGPFRANRFIGWFPGLKPWAENL